MAKTVFEAASGRPDYAAQATIRHPLLTYHWATNAIGGSVHWNSTLFGRIAKFAGTSTAALALGAFSPACLPQAYPSKPVRIVVPYDPGGAIDLTARLYQQQLTSGLGQQVLVENRPGATGKVGAESVARAEPDGYVLLYTVAGDMTLWQAKPDTPEPVRNLTPITSAVTSVGIIAARTDLPLNSIGELLEFVRRNPGKLSYGSSGVGSFQHLIGERLKQQGVDMLHVPYKGVAPALAALSAGQIDIAITNLATGMPFANQGKIKILALTQSSRFEAAPGIPAINEAMPGFQMPPALYGFFGPPGLPRPIASRIATEVAKTLEAPEVKKRLTDLSMVAVITTTPEQFSALMHEIADSYQKIVKAANIRLD
jgi:tripartite-type tricarboxylate transporter receptor subunit TctC